MKSSVMKFEILGLTNSTDLMFSIMKANFQGLEVLSKASFEASCGGKYMFEKDGLAKTIIKTITSTITATRGVTVKEPSTFF